MLNYRSVVVIVSLVVFFPLWIQAQGALPPEVERHGYADLVVVNGKIVSMDDAGINTNPGNIYEAMAAKGGRIIALGTNQHIRTLANTNTTVFDLAGKLVIPGIIHTHTHLYGGGDGFDEEMGIRTPDRGVRVNVMAGRDIESTRLVIENAITDATAKLPPGEWVVVGVGANREEEVTGQRLRVWTVAEDLEPRTRLDRVAPQHPVIVRVGTRANINSQAIDVISQYMPGYELFLNESMGAPYPDAAEKGLVGSQEQGAITWEIWYRNVPLSLLAERVRRSMERTAAHGYTTFSSRVPMPRVMDTFTWLNREKQMPMRFGALYEVHRLPNDPQVTRQMYRLTGNLTGLGNDYLWIHGVASERWDTNFPEWCMGPDLEAPPRIKAREVCPAPGTLWWDVLQNAMEAGWRLAGIHGVGSDSVRRFIRLIDMVRDNTGMTVEDVRKMRFTMEHSPAIGAVPDIIEGLKKYGIYVKAGRFSGVNDYFRDYGPGIEPFLSRPRTLLDHGVKVVGETGIGGYWVQYMTRNINGRILNPAEALDRVEVLKMYTNWAAEYVMKDDDLGSLEVGKFADFTVLDRDYFQVPVEEIHDIVPQMTVVGGKPVYLHSGLAAQLGMQPVGYQHPAGHRPWASSYDND
ncbi:MAG: amidohydrolase family protein [Acidobacteria bacterium]|nr:amidohydrolase family protein [Acidobacteriota bacterium]